MYYCKQQVMKIIVKHIIFSLFIIITHLFGYFSWNLKIFEKEGPDLFFFFQVTLSRQKACQTLGNMCVLLYYNYEGRRQKNMNQACQLFRSLSTLAQRRYAVDDWYVGFFLFTH